MNEIFIIIVIACIGISYYFIFKEHHKRNHLKFADIYPLVIEYAVICVISILLLVVGFKAVINGYVNRDEIREVLKELIVGLVTICLVIIHYIYWIKKHKFDVDIGDVEARDEKNAHIAEYIEICVFVIIIIGSIYNIIKYAQFIDKVEKYRQISISVLCIISSIILLHNLNPLKIKDKIKKIIKSKK